MTCCDSQATHTPDPSSLLNLSERVIWGLGGSWQGLELGEVSVEGMRFRQRLGSEILMKGFEVWFWRRYGSEHLEDVWM